MNERIERLLKRSSVTVAYATAIPDEIVGYSVQEGPVLHYAYVKSAYRRQRVATGLVSDTAAEYSHMGGKPGREFMKKLGLTYNPFHLERKSK